MSTREPSVEDGDDPTSLFEDVAPLSLDAPTFRLIDETRFLDAQSPIFTRKPFKAPEKPMKRTFLDHVRSRLAIGILAGLFVLYLLLFVAAIWWHLDTQMVQVLATILSGPQALAAAAVGFYYATRETQELPRSKDGTDA